MCPVPLHGRLGLAQAIELVVAGCRRVQIVQVRDLEAAASFHTDVLGFSVNAAISPPVARLTETGMGAIFAVRGPHGPLPDEPGAGCSSWFDVADLDAVYDGLTGADADVVSGPEPGGFGRQFSVRDPDGYALTFHQTD